MQIFFVFFVVNVFCIFYSKYTLSLCATQQQASSNLQASKQSRSERKNTQRECVFAERRRLFTTEGSKQSKLVHTVSGYFLGNRE